MLVMEKTERYFCACLLSSSDSSCPLSFLVMSSDARTQRGKDTRADTILFLKSGKVRENLDGEIYLRTQSSLKTMIVLPPMTISIKNKVQ